MQRNCSDMQQRNKDFLTPSHPRNFLLTLRYLVGRGPALLQWNISDRKPFLSFNPCGSVVKGLSFTSASGAQSRSSHPAWASTRTPAGSKLAQRVRKRQRPSGTEGSSLTQAWVAAGRQHQHQRRPVGSRALRSR